MSTKTAFFAMVKEFISGLRVVFPELWGDLNKLETYIDIGESTVPKLVINEFMTRIGEFYQQIIDRNELFFRENLNYERTFQDTCDELNVNTKVAILVDRILRFIGREWDQSLKTTHKQEIWNHLQSMIVMGAAAYDNGRTYGHIIAYASQKTS